MIRVYFHHTPNPVKVVLLLEETGLDYQLVPVDTYRSEQHSAHYRAINPNGKVPAIDDSGVRVFDSNAILLYLAEKTGRFLGTPAQRPEMLSWLMFVASGLGPFSGQAVHFSRVHVDSPYATNRYPRCSSCAHSGSRLELHQRDGRGGDAFAVPSELCCLTHLGARTASVTKPGPASMVDGRPGMLNQLRFEGTLP